MLKAMYLKNKHRDSLFLCFIFTALPCDNLKVSGFKKTWYKENFEGIYLIQPKREWCDETHPTYRMKDNRILSWLTEYKQWVLGYTKCTSYVSLIV